MELQTILFWLLSLLGIAGGIGLVINRNPVYSALSLILNFFCIAGLYLTLQAEFLAIIQILVYAGAIMVLFLFVIMLLNLQDEPKRPRFELSRIAAYVLAGGFVAELLVIFRRMGEHVPDPQVLASPYEYGTAEAVGREMMTSYLFPFEMISVVLIASLIGAIVIAKKFNYDTDGSDS